MAQKLVRSKKSKLLNQQNNLNTTIMKPKMFTLVLFTFIASALHAQDITTVNAKSSDIGDNLDLKAVASIFGDSENLEDFERRLNDPKIQISNLDLNGDGRVDYLRVIESVEGGTHLIVIQSVLEKDVFQDVATVEVERDNNNNVQVQVVGDVYMYGPNYIYEPVYVQRPIIYNTFWVGSYHPYYSPWYWNYYPVYYSYWSPYPVYRYRRNIHVHINTHHHYNYVTTRRSTRAIALHRDRRANGYERSHPNRSFEQRNNVANRYELDKTRNSLVRGGRKVENQSTPSPSTRTTGTPKKTSTIRNTASGNQTLPTRTTPKTEKNSTITRSNSNQTVAPAQNTTRVVTKKQETPQVQTPIKVSPNTNSSVPRTTTPKVVAPRNETKQVAPVQRNESVTPRNTAPRSQERVNSGSSNRTAPQNAPRENSRRGNSRG